MKNFLTRIFSVALIGVTAFSPSYAQTLKRVSAGPARVAAKAATEAGLKSVGARKAGTINVAGQKTAPGPFRQKGPSGIAGTPQVKFAESANMPELYGSIIMNDAMGTQPVTMRPGLYAIPKSGSTQPTLIVPEANSNGNGVLFDGVYHSIYWESFMGMEFVQVTYYDVETGEQTATFAGMPEDIMTMGLTHDPVSGNCYGVSMNDDRTAVVFKQVVFTPTGITHIPIGNIEENVNALMADNTGQLYAITYTGENQGGQFVATKSYLKKLDKATGALTTVGETGFAPQYVSSAVINPRDNRCYWNVVTPDRKSYMCEVSLQTGQATALFRLALNDEIMGMSIPAPGAAAGAPAECSDISLDFPGGSLQGTVSLTAPALNFDGSAGSGQLTVTVLANDEQVAQTETGYGGQVSLDVDLSQKGAGKYDLTVYASNAAGDGPKARFRNMWIGPDTPEATTATLTYANGNMEVTWLPVTASINGGYIDVDNLTYTVKRHDGTIAAEGLTVTAFTEQVAMPEELTSFYYTVEAVCGGVTSAPARTNTVMLGSILPPFDCDFDDGDLSGWTIIDVNEDMRTWEAYYGAVRCRFHDSNDMNDWLITPSIKLEAGKAYNVSFKAKAYTGNFPERIEVKYGKSPTAQGMTLDLVAPTDVPDGNWMDIMGTMTPPEDGVYYIGFHGISDADMAYLWVDDVHIAAAVSALCPGEATNLTATPDSHGALKCSVEFDAPFTTMDGQPLGSLTKV